MKLHDQITALTSSDNPYTNDDAKAWAYIDGWRVGVKAAAALAAANEAKPVCGGTGCRDLACLSCGGSGDAQMVRGEPDPIADTGDEQANRIISRLMSADPEFDDCADAARMIQRLIAENKGPYGFATWKDAAVSERIRRVQSERECCQHGIHLQNACGACIPPRGTSVAAEEKPVQGDPCREAIALVCEGWTLPDGARKILEAALYTQPVQGEQKPVGVVKHREGDYGYHFEPYADWTTLLGKELYTAQPTDDKLRAALAFADHVINGVFEGSDWDGGDLQDLAVQHGLLKRAEIAQPCGEDGSCQCARNGAEFPTECYRKTYLAGAA